MVGVESDRKGKEVKTRRGVLVWWRQRLEKGKKRSVLEQSV